MLAAGGDIAHRLLEGGAIGDLVGGHAELRADGIGELAAHQAHRRRHRMAGLEAAHHDLQRPRQLLAEQLGAAARHDLQIEERDYDRGRQPGGDGQQRLVRAHEGEAGPDQAKGGDVERPFAWFVGKSRAQHQLGQEADPALPVLLQAPLLAQLQHQLAQGGRALGRGQAPVHHPLGGAHPHQAPGGLSRREHRREQQQQEGGLRVQQEGGKVHGAVC